MKQSGVYCFKRVVHYVGVNNKMKKNRPVSREPLIVGDDIAQQNEEAGIVTPLGSQSPSSIGNQTLQLLNLIISFFTSVYVTLMLQQYQGFEILLLMFLVMYIWNEISVPTRKWLGTFDDGGFGWAKSLAFVLDVFSKVIILIVFEYASALIFILWRRAGLKESEKIAFGITIVLIVTALFNYVLYSREIQKRDKHYEGIV